MSVHIPFNKPPQTGRELEYIAKAIASGKLSGDGEFTCKCTELLEQLTGMRVLLTTSCTHALEMVAILMGIEPGDEVIMPSYTFVSTANAFVLRGAVPVFVDIHSDTMNIDENLIEPAITPQTKAIVPVHYAGVGCEMDEITRLAKKHNLYVIEDAAQGLGAKYNGSPLGGLSDFAALSFHETKNVSSGEGGAFLVKDAAFFERAEIIREKGTNRSQFWRGEMDKYTWVDIGSSYLPSELNAAYLLPQLEDIDKLNARRLTVWRMYYDALLPLAQEEWLSLPVIPENCEHNAHMFYIKLKDSTERTRLITHLKSNGILSVFHYIPLHSSPAGQRYGRFCGEDVHTTRESERLLRLPLYHGITETEVEYVVTHIKEFFSHH